MDMNRRSVAGRNTGQREYKKEKQRGATEKDKNRGEMKKRAKKDRKKETVARTEEERNDRNQKPPPDTYADLFQLFRPRLSQPLSLT